MASALFVPHHIIPKSESAEGVYHNGRYYKHVPSKIKKRSEDDEILLTLHRAQWEPYSSKARFRVVVAGRRWGKTHWTCIELLEAAAKKPRQKVWYVAPTYSMANQIAWEKLKEIVPLKWIARKGPQGALAINESRMRITLVNGSTITLKGADRPDALRGVGVHFLVLDEYQDFKKGTWEQVLRATLSDTRGRAIFIGTPKSFNHLYEMYERGKGKNPQWAAWQFKTGDSPFIPAAELESAKDDLDPRTYRQEYEASFESMAGRIYYDFDRRQNVRRCAYDPNLPVMIGQDFNVDPMSSVIMQRHGDELHAFGELSLRSSSTEEVCKELLSEYGWRLKEIATIYPDPAGAARSSARGESDIQIFREWGFNRILYRKKHPLRRDRYAAVNRMICDAKGERRLIVDPSCKELIKGFEQMIYKEDTSEPDKKSGVDHMPDAIGYPIEYEWPVKRTFEMVGFSR